MNSHGHFTRECRAFTLVEMMVSLVILLMVVGIVFSIVNMVTKMNARVSAGVSVFQDASLALEHVSRRISQATLNTYWDYNPPQTGENPLPPENYIRMSDLHFVTDEAEKLGLGSGASYPTKAVFFQAPIGYSQDVSDRDVTNLLNVCGFYVELGDNHDLTPPIPALQTHLKSRYRLMELVQPTEEMTVYSTTKTNGVGGELNRSYSWFLDPLQTRPVYSRPVADNIIAFVVQPKLADAEDPSVEPVSRDYHYDSREGTISKSGSSPQPMTQNQLPPLLRITLVAIDEGSAARLADRNGGEQPEFVGGNLFHTTDDYEEDLKTLERTLAGMKVTYRIFTTDVPMRSAKWSTQ